MSMTREEAIAAYEKLYKYMLGDEEFVGLSYGEFMELSRYIRAVLRTPTREQVEKMRGEWIVEDAGEGDRRGKCSMCGYRTPWGLRFCPACGAPMTDEAVEMVMERLEALKDE